MSFFLLFMFFFFFFFFFFSSRRRHTRYWRDWSSDVCSSDLNKIRCDGTNTSRTTMSLPPVPATLQTNQLSTISQSPIGRSEERRVGKECRSRWSRCD